MGRVPKVCEGSRKSEVAEQVPMDQGTAWAMQREGEGHRAHQNILLSCQALCSPQPILQTRI